jgi:hypothetical protein
MTTGSTGRSPGPVWVVAMASTTSREAWSATSPKIVCLKFSHVVAPTVMKNCEPVVERAAAAVAGVVVLLAGRETGEVGDRLGRVVREEVEDDVASVGLEDGLRVSHDCLSRDRGTPEDDEEPSSSDDPRTRGKVTPRGHLLG